MFWKREPCLFRPLVYPQVLAHFPAILHKQRKERRWSLSQPLWGFQPSITFVHNDSINDSFRVHSLQGSSAKEDVAKRFSNWVHLSLDGETLGAHLLRNLAGCRPQELKGKGRTPLWRHQVDTRHAWMWLAAGEWVLAELLPGCLHLKVITSTVFSSGYNAQLAQLSWVCTTQEEGHARAGIPEKTGYLEAGTLPCAVPVRNMVARVATHSHGLPWFLNTILQDLSFPRAFWQLERWP